MNAILKRTAAAVLLAAVSMTGGLGAPGLAAAKYVKSPPVTIVPKPGPITQKLYLQCWVSTATIPGLMSEHKVKIRNPHGHSIKAGTVVYWRPYVRALSRYRLGGSKTLGYDLQPGSGFDFKIPKKISGCTAWIKVSLTR